MDKITLDAMTAVGTALFIAMWINVRWLWGRRNQAELKGHYNLGGREINE